MLKQLLILNLFFISCNLESAETKAKAENKYLEISPENSTLLKYIFNNNTSLQINDLQSEILEYLTKYIPIKSYNCDRQQLSRVCALPNDNLIVSFGNDIQIWDINGQCLKVFKGHSDWVMCVCTLPNNQFASASQDNTIKIWDVNSGNCLKTMKSFSAARSLLFLEHNKLVSGHYRIILAWDIDSGECLDVKDAGTNLIQSLCLVQNDKFASACTDGMVKIWDIETTECLQTLDVDTTTGGRLCTLPNNKLAVVAQEKISIWNLDSQKCERSLLGHTTWVNSLCLLSNGLLVSGSSDGTIRIWNINLGECLEVLSAHAVSVSSICKLSDGKFVSSGYDLGDLKTELNNHGDSLKTIKIWGAFDLTITPDQIV